MRKSTFSILLHTSLALRLLPAADADLKLTVAGVQFRSSLNINANCERMVGHLQRLARTGVQVAVFPECALTGYTTAADFAPSPVEIEAAKKQLAQTCRSSKIAAVIGIQSERPWV